jgi:hypothetical protein
MGKLSSKNLFPDINRSNAGVKMSEYDLVLLRNLKKLYGWQEEEAGHFSKKDGLAIFNFT